MKDETKIQIKKNILDIEYHTNFNYFLTCIILFTTILGLIIGVMSIYRLTFETIGSPIIIFIVIVLAIIIIIAGRFKRKYEMKLKEIKELLK